MTSMSSPEPTAPPRTPGRPVRAVVIGGGLTGMLAAQVLSRHADEVTVVERGELPEGPRPRKEIPQARHVHLLYSGGARVIEDLIPGVTEGWLAAGARRIPLTGGLVSYTAQGWLRRWPVEMQFMIACTRDLLDWGVRERVLRRRTVRLLDRHELLALTGTRHGVTGVRVRTPDGAERTLDADLVVDASGAGSRIRHRLAEIGVTGIEEEKVDSGLTYASRFYRAPAGAENFPVVNVQSAPRAPVPGQTATIVPVEDRRWQVTLSGTRGGEPTGDPDLFESFARGVRHPVVGQLLARTEPLPGDIAVSRSTVNGRRYFERAPHWPERFVALGDSVATYNPLYAQGMSVAAQGVAAMERELVRAARLDTPGLARRIQRAVAEPADLAWQIATSQDVLYPGTTVESRGGRPRSTALVAAYVDRLTESATGRMSVTQALFDVITLSAPATRWLHPDVVVAALRGPGRRQLEAPPLTAKEWEAVGGNDTNRP
ncbi:FAD-dependent monooxygenase [Streptomyces sp. NPDC059248]|uniref:FAD-dependent monooxygenase n=1 Tax=Streptomyces sp. NPDC059248 TaxID=3346791 RepID=UPI0036CB5A65